MEYAIYGWFAADVGKDVMVPAKSKELLKCHLAAVCITISGIDVT